MLPVGTVLCLQQMLEGLEISFLYSIISFLFFPIDYEDDSRKTVTGVRLAYR